MKNLKTDQEEINLITHTNIVTEMNIHNFNK